MNCGIAHRYIRRSECALGTREQKMFCFLKSSDGGFARDGGKPFQKLFESFTALQIVEQRLDGHARSTKHRCSAKNIGVFDDNSHERDCITRDGTSSGRKSALAKSPYGAPAQQPLELGGLALAADDFENVQVSDDVAFVLSPAADSSVGAPVASRVIFSGQTVSLREAQHGGAIMHVHGLHRIGEGLTLVLVEQSDALRVGYLNFGDATSRHGRNGGEVDGNFGPSLENLEHHVITLGVVVKGGNQEAAPTAGEIWDSTKSQFAHDAIAPELLVEERVEHAVEKQAGGRVQPPGCC